MGNSDDIAQKHYFQTTHDHSARAISGPSSEGGAQSGAPMRAKSSAASARGESQRIARIDENP
jgi:hypothetical protein